MFTSREQVIQFCLDHDLIECEDKTIHSYDDISDTTGITLTATGRYLTESLVALYASLSPDPTDILRFVAVGFGARSEAYDPRVQPEI